MFDKSSSSPETLWGLSWRSLFASLRPTPDEIAVYESIISEVKNVLAKAHLPHDIQPGGAFGKGNMQKGDKTLFLYSIHTPFIAANYSDVYLNPIVNTLLSVSSFTDLKETALAVVFNASGVKVHLSAAGIFYGGPKDLLLPLNQAMRKPSLEGSDFAHIIQEASDVQIHTTCAVLRTQFIGSHPPLYHDLVRVAKKWRSECQFSSAAITPGDYLIELLMLEAFKGAPCLPHATDLYATILRRFFSLAATKSGSGSDVMADDSMPKSMLWWDSFYNRGAIDLCIAKGLVDVNRNDKCSVIIIDPTAPFVNVARSIPDWTELRNHATESLMNFQNTGLLDTLKDRLQVLSVGMQATISRMQNQLENLHHLEVSPRRWSGTIQFNEAHINSDTWTSIADIKLRTILWRMNVRKARMEGYSTCVDISIQMIGERLQRPIDVDVLFRGGTINLVFDENVDHVLIAKRSEVVRNRDYPVQITVIA